jgi:hypothetical protein
LGKADALNERMRVADNESQTLEIELSTKSGRIEGTVNDAVGKPVPGAQAVLIPASPTRIDLYRTQNTDAKGHFEMRGVAPGEYRMFSWEALEGNMYFDPKFVALYGESGTRVRVTESSTATATVNRIAASQ